MDGNAEITFIKNGNAIKLVSSEVDFVGLAFTLKSIVRDGQKKIIEIKDTSTFYDNICFFDTKAGAAVREGIKEIVAGTIKLESSFSVEKAFLDIDHGNYKSLEIKELVEKYKYVLGYSMLKMQFIWGSFEKARKNAYDPTRFLSLLNLAGKVYQDCLFQLPPLETVKVHGKVSKIDLDHIGKSLVQHNTTVQEKWEGMTSKGTKPVDGKIAATTMVSDYQGYYEITKKMLRHLAFIIANSKGISNVESEAEIERLLSENGYGLLLDSVDRRLRNCGTHWDADYSEKGKVKLIDSRGKKARVIGEISSQEIVDNLHLIRDLTTALFFSMVLMEELVYFRALDSPDLKFLLVENYKP